MFADDTALVEALRREGGDWAEDQARELGALLRAAADDPLGRRGEPEPAQAPHP